MANNYTGCNNNCEAVAGLQEKAANLVAYSDLINSWLNGPVNGTVNIAGVNTSTLLKFVTDLRTRINQMPQSILEPNGGIKIDSDGMLYIDFNSMPPELLYALLQKIVLPGGGLAFNQQGKMYVDFENMPTEKFDEILEAFREGLHLPIWLAASLNLYVDKNHAQASDIIVDGRGLSASLPFKTIQACYNFVCDNYNLGNYNAYIKIAPATYEEYIQAGNFQSTGGAIYLSSTSETDKFVIRGIYPDSNGVINLERAKIEYANSARPGSSGYQALSASSYINLFDVEIDTKTGSSHNKRMIQSNTGGNVILRSGTVFKGECYSALETQGGYIGIFSPSVVNNVTMSMAFAFTNGSGSIGVTDVGNGIPTFSGSATGYRYRISGNGRISTGGQGENYFPGTIAGVISPDNKYS